jgi:hypothetical protein
MPLFSRITAFNPTLPPHVRRTTITCAGIETKLSRIYLLASTS